MYCWMLTGCTNKNILPTTKQRQQQQQNERRRKTGRQKFYLFISRAGNFHTNTIPFHPTVHPQVIVFRLRNKCRTDLLLYLAGPPIRSTTTACLRVYQPTRRDAADAQDVKAEKGIKTKEA